MLDFVTTIIGVSFTVLAIAAIIVAVSLVYCIVMLIQNLPKGIRAFRDATESSLFVLAFCGHDMAEHMWFGKLHNLVGRYIVFGFCGICISVVYLFDCGGRLLFGSPHRDNGRLSRAAATPGRVCGRCVMPSVPAAFQKLSVVMKQ